MFIAPFLLLCISSVQGAEVIERAPSSLLVGEQRLLQFTGIERFSVGGPSIRIHPWKPSRERPTGTSESLLIKAIQPGISDLWVWNRDGSTEHRSFEVLKNRGPGMKPELTLALGRLEESEVLLSGEGAVLRGQIHSRVELGRVSALAQGFPKEIRDETEPDPKLLDRAQKELEAWLQDTTFARSLRLERDGEKVRLAGNLDRVQDRALVEKRARSILPSIQLDLQALPDEAPTIHFKVFLLELKKSRFRSLGLSWPGSVASAFRVSTWGIQEALQFDLALQALEGEGSAKILSKPEIVVRAPGEAELFSGGEIPIRTTTQYSSQVAWKPYGLLLKLKVTHQTGDRVRLEILTEVSHLDLQSASSDIPGLQANRMKTEVDARFGKPLLLSGLLQDGVREQAKGVPWLRRIPVLGPLFGSEDYLNERSELVAILLPQIVPPAAPMEMMSPLPTQTETEISAPVSRIPSGTHPRPTPRTFHRHTPESEGRPR